MKLTDKNHTKIKKYIRIVLIAVFCCASMSVFSQHQNVNVSGVNQTLKTIFKQIEQQTQLSIDYDAKAIDDAKTVKTSIKGKTVKAVLDEILSGSGCTIVYEGSHVIIKKATASSKKIITGIVLDETGEPITGANIVEKGSSANGTITGMDGDFSLEVANDAILAVSYIGYVTHDVSVKNQKTVSITLKENTQTLEEVVVVGYGTQSRARVTGSIAQIKSDKIRDMAVSGFEQAIAGQLPGVQVSQQSGTPGGGSSIKIRGASSITAGTNPLIVIDGYPETTSNTSTFLNPEDIESIEVLKDASAAAIYGSRGANGVIVITTKRGKEGKAKINIKAYYGVQTAAKKIDMIDAYEYANFVAEARNNYWLDLNPGVNQITDDNSKRAKKARIPEYLMPYLNGESGLTNTDWQDEIFRTASIQQYDLSVSGGAEKVSYYTSLSYVDQDGIIENSDFKRLSLRSNLNAKLYKWLTFDFNLAPSYSVRNLVSQDNHKQDGVVLLTAIANPAAEARDADGNVIYGDQIKKGLAWGTSVIESPLAIAKSIEDKYNQFRILGNTNINIQFFKELKFKAHFGADYYNAKENYFRPSYLGNYNTQAPTQASGKYYDYRKLNWVTEHTLNYKKDFGKHGIDLLVGFSAQKETSTTASMKASNFPNDNVHTLNAGIVSEGLTNDETWTLASFFARANYFYENKYLLSASVRRDGSSRFGSNNRWGTFPAVSIGWRISEEPWMKNVKSINELKVRMSYGMTGNFQIPNYGSYSLMQAYNYVFSANLANGLAPYTSPNPSISWEKTGQYNFGIDVGILNNALSFSADYYSSKTKDLLLDVPVPASSGFTTSLQNIGRVKNEGVEFAVKGNFDFNGFMWTPSFNISANKNEVLELGPNQEQIIQGNHITKIGHPIGSYYGYNIIGVYKNQEELDKYPHLSTAKIGTYIYEDLSGDGVIDDSDRKMLGNYNPDYTIGFHNSMSYKNIDFSFMLQIVQGSEIMNLSNVFLLNAEGWGNTIKSFYNNHYSESNQNAKYARPTVATPDKLYEKSNYMIEDGSFVRFNNVTLGYSFPKKLLHNLKLERLRLYFTAQNPFTITKYSGYNPEVSSTETYPSALTPGVDYGAYPTSKSFSFGLNLTF